MRESFWLVNPELRNRRGQNQQGDNEILGRLRLLSTEDQERQHSGKREKYESLDVGRIFQAPQQLIPGPAAADLFRGEAASNQLIAFEEIEHEPAIFG